MLILISFIVYNVGTFYIRFLLLCTLKDEGINISLSHGNYSVVNRAREGMTCAITFGQ